MPPSAHPGTLLAPFQSLFSAPTWRKAQRLLIGTLLAHGRRTVTAALRHTGQGDTPSFSLYHQVLESAKKWGPFRRRMSQFQALDPKHLRPRHHGSNFP